MIFDNKINKIIYEMNQDKISQIKNKIKKLKNERDYARSKDEGGEEHVNLTNQINNLKDQLKKLI